jgi:hypothetical protein
VSYVVLIMGPAEIKLAMVYPESFAHRAVVPFHTMMFPFTVDASALKSALAEVGPEGPVGPAVMLAVRFMVMLFKPAGPAVMFGVRFIDPVAPVAPTDPVIPAGIPKLKMAAFGVPILTTVGEEEFESWNV